jgi:NDP-4-keto-2,6-dideoxyhexose 3-C-methyltransferase
MIQPIKACRICSNQTLLDVVDLGEQTLTGVFPASPAQAISRGPIVLVKCVESDSKSACGLLQLKHSYPLNELYGENYGYRSGLNQSMVNHLTEKVKTICQRIKLEENDIIIDIGSNDATTLKAYPKGNYKIIGIDPTAEKFAEFYTENIMPIFDFFTAERVKEVIGNEKAKVITSFSMFYDLEQPLLFAEEVASLLDDDGIWVCEQSYMPTMLKQNSFDTICHEHLEYYGLRQMHWIAEHAGLKILDVEFNDINGGSFSLVMATKNSTLKINKQKIDALIYQELLLGLDTEFPYFAFAKRIALIKTEITTFFNRVKQDKKIIYGLGASTKGNVLLQYCQLDNTHLPAIGEVNVDKFGSYTPGSLIPILPESEIIARQPDYLFVLPWHFRSFFDAHLKLGKTELVYPLPSLDIAFRDSTS